MKKIYAIFMLCVLGFTAVFSACGDPYKDMQLQVLTGDTVTIYLTDNVDDVPEGELAPNTAQVQAQVSGVGDGVSRVVEFVSHDTSKLQVATQQTEGDTTTATILAQAPGVVNLEAITEEGGLSQTITVFIYRNVSAISFNSSYNPAVIANGEPTKIDETQVRFTPSDSNIRDLEYSLVGDPVGATIDSEGYLTVTNSDLQSVRVQVRPVVRESDEVYAEIDVEVLPSIDVNNLQLSSTFGDEPVDLPDSIHWVKNDPNTALQVVSFAYNDLAYSALLRIRAVIGDQTKIVERESSRTNSSVTLSGIDTGSVSVRFEVYYEGHEDIVVLSKTVQYQITEAVNTISANNGITELTIYNATSTSLYRGTALTVQLRPTTASNLKYRIEIDELYVDHISIVNATGGNPYDADGNINSGTTIYLTHDGEIANDNFTLRIVPAGDFICQPLDISVTCLTSVEEIVTAQDEIMLGFSESTQVGTVAEIQYSVLPQGALKETVQVVSNNESVAFVYYDEELNTHIVRSTGIGSATISFIVNNRVLRTISVSCVAPYSTFLASVDAPADNPNVSGRTMVQVTDENTGQIIGRTLESAVIKVGASININVAPYPSNSRLKEITYTVEAVDGNANLVSIDANGIMRVESEVAEFRVIINAIGYTYDLTGAGNLIEVTTTREVYFTAIMPITSISINTSSVEIYDANTVGIDEISQAQARLYVTINPSDATINAGDVIWSVSDDEFESLLEVQSDGSVLITGRLSGGEQQRTFTVHGEVHEYDRIYSVECRVRITRATTVEQILLSNYDEARGVYLRSSDVNGGYTGDTYQIDATAMPADAKNPNFRYYAFDINPINSDIEGWYWDEDLYTRVDSSRIQVSNTGLISTVAGATGGYSVVWVVAADNIHSDPINFNDIRIKRVVLVYVADGTVENPYEIDSYTDFINIAQAPDKAYRIVETIDFSSIRNYSPIGTAESHFTGYLTGRYVLSNGRVVINSLVNIRFSANIQQSAYQGLFGIIGQNATITDLNLTVMANSLEIELPDEQSYYFGYLAGVNNGTISNVTVRFNGNLSINNIGSGTINIGGVVGENYGTVSNSRSLTYNNFGIEVVQADSISYIGGLVGYNAGNITGQFEYVGDSLEASGSDIDFNVNFNDETLNSSIMLSANSQNVVLGGISAINSGSIDGAYSSARIQNITNVGGIVGINTGSIFSVRFTGFITANSLAGGIAGENRENGSIIFGIVEITDDMLHFTDLDASLQVAQFGGVVGLNSGDISYSYINSYSAQRSEHNNNIDMYINSAQITTFGAFVGENAGNIDRSFANVQINVNQLFYGLGSSNISNSYSLSYVGEFNGNINQSFYDGDALATERPANSANFIARENMNFGLPMIIIDQTVYNDKGQVLLTQSLEKIVVTVYGEGNLNTSQFGKDSSTNRYYKVSDTQVLLLLNNSLVSEELNVNTYDLSQMFNITVTPASERNKTIIVTVIQGQNVISVEGSTITALSEGYAVLRFASDLDNAVYDDIEVYVSYGITDLSVANIELREENQQTYRELRLQLDTSFNFDITNQNSIQTGDTTTSYTPLQSGGYLFEFDTVGVVEFDRAEQVDDWSYYVRFADSQIITTLLAGQTNTTIYPYIEAVYYVDGVATPIKVVLRDVAYSFNLYIYRGLTDVVLPSSSEEIMPSTTLNYQVTLNTDLSESVLDSLLIYQGDITGDEEQAYERFDLSSSTLNSANKDNFHKDVSATSKFGIDILDISFDESNSQKNIVFEIVPSREINGSTAILEREEYTLVFSATLGSGQVISKQFKLTLKPQVLTTILANHYNDGADFDSNLSGAGEEVSTRIIPGQYGLLIINLWPEYSVFDRLEVVSSVASNDVITFEQVYLNLDANNYDTLVENTQIIDNGISVSRQSTKHYDVETGQFVYEFDGRIFLRTLTGTQVQTGDVFTITIRAYNEDETSPYITQTIELTALQAPYLTFDFTSGRSYKGISHEYYAAEQTNYNFTMTTDASVNEMTGITTSIYDANGSVLTGVRLVKTGDTVVSNNRQTINYVISANSAFVKGQEYYVEMIVTRTNSGVTTRARIVNTLHIVDFLVTGFNIVDGSLNENDSNYILVSDGLLSRPLTTTGWQISIKLQTVASESNTLNRVSAIERILNGQDRLMGTYYNPWKYMVMSGPNVGQFDTIASEDVSNNFTLSNDEDGTGYWLVGNSIANVDTLMADFSYYYDANGNFALTNDPTISIDGNPSMQFRLNFSLSSSQDHPLPIYTAEEFLAMEEGIDYILLDDINLGTNYTPLSTAISSLDGNGYTITIDSFSLPTEQSDSVYVGLFSQVNADTLLKNVTVRFSDFQTLDLTGYTNVYFGAIAGQNNGIITNAFVDFIDEYGNRSMEVRLTVPSSSDEGQTQAYIGGAVGENLGIITNSRVEHMYYVASGTMGGFVGVNNGTISSSYVLEPTIQSTNGVTGGFASVNNGEINTSYVRGEYSSTSIRAVNSTLNTVGQVGGFVYQNNASISDCYANIRIVSQSRSAGFVYENAMNGEIYNCLSLSDIIQNSIAHMPFVGTDASDRFLNQGTLSNAYFYQNDDDRFVAYDIDGSENPAQKMTEADLGTTASLAGFAFSDSNSEFSGVWVLPTATNEYFNANDYYGNATQGTDDKLSFKTGIPELVAPNVIAKSVRRIDSIDTDQMSGESIYNYVYVTQANATEGERVGYEYGTIHNQALINTVDDFIYLYENYQSGQLVTTSSINSRLINNVDFSTYDQTLNTPMVTLSGIIEGNGLYMANISVVSNVDERYTEFGLFKSIRGDSNTGFIAGIKNLAFSFIEVLASSSNIVGSVAGSMHNANLIDIEVQGNDVAVMGANIVGGVVGLVTGNSTLYNITTNISANSGYRNSGNNTIQFESSDGSNTITVENADNVIYVNDELFYSNVDEALLASVNSTPLKNTYNYVSYAGAVAGVVETMHEENIMECYMIPNVYDITVDGNVRVIGATAGGVIGMAGLYTFVSNVDFVINQSSYISADDIAGGLIGELRGKLSQSSIIHTEQDSINNLNFGATSEDINMSLFRTNTTTKASGGLVGFNLGGTILDCISYAYVRNAYSNFAGGAVGVTIAGDIKATIATGSVVGRTSVGGLIGGVIATNNTGRDSFYNYSLLPLYYDNEFNIDNSLQFDVVVNGDGSINYDQNSMVLSYIMAGNNWTTADQATLSYIDNWGGLIGYFDGNLNRSYINTTHPQDANSRVNLINFYVAGGNNTDLLPTRGNEDTEGGDWIHIAEPITFSSLTAENKEDYFGNYYRFVWDLSGDSKYPSINLQAVPETIEVATASDLLQIIWNLSANYLIVDDIDLSGIDSWLPLGSDNEPFSGTLRSAVKVQDSSGLTTKNTYYKISNLKIVASNLRYIGLFGVTGFNYLTQQGAVFENLVIEVEQIVGSDFTQEDAFVGALVADARGAQINNVVTTPASINSMIVSSSDYTGGIVGRLSNLESDVDKDEEDPSKGKIVIKSSIKNSLSNLDIGILNRSTNNYAGEISNVGGVVGQLRAGTIENTASNQSIFLVGTRVDDLTGQVVYEPLSLDTDYGTQVYYTQNLYVGGLVGSNSSQNLSAGGNTEEGGQQEVVIQNSFSNTEIEIAQLNLLQVSDNGVDTILGGFAGVLDESIDITSSFSTGKITTNGAMTTETTANEIVISGFAGKVLLSYEDSTEQVIRRSYSLVTLLDESNTADIKGFAYIGYQNSDLTDNSNAVSVLNECYYEHYYALVVDYDENFGTSSDSLRNIFRQFNEFSLNQEGVYYPVLVQNNYALGINDRTDYVVYGPSKGTKLNPILIDSETSLIGVSESANNGDDYLYYLVTQDIPTISNHVENAQGDIVSNNSPMINAFTGFLNGNGFFVGGFTIKETPKTFDSEYNVIEEEDETVENAGLIRILRKGSFVSGLSLQDVYIDYQSSNENDNSTINVGGLVGTMEDGAGIFASTVSGDIFVKGAQYTTTTEGITQTNSRNQTLNIGGLVGYANGGKIINSANYARVASFDYIDYKNIAGENTTALNTINAGGLVGKIDNGASLLSVFTISQFNFIEDSVYADTLNYGSLAGYAQDSTIRDWYAKVDLIEREYGEASRVTTRVGQEITSSSGVNSNIIENENVQIITEDSDLTRNYGYEFAPLLAEGVPYTQITAINGQGEDTIYYAAGNTESLMYLLNNNLNVTLTNDLYLDSEILTTVQNYTGQFNGQFNSIYGLDTVLINNVGVGSQATGTRIENVAISGTAEYNGDANFVFSTLGSSAVVSTVDLKTTSNSLSLSENTNSGASFLDINSNTRKVITDDAKWMNLSLTDDANASQLRSFVEYWDETDVRGIYLSEVEATFTEIVVDDDGNEVPTESTEMRLRINDSYQLAKFAKLINDGDKLSLDVIELNHNSVFDLCGKIWNSLSMFESSLVSSSEAENEKALITNLYAEGMLEVGFIGNYNSAEGRLFNLEFRNAKLVEYPTNTGDDTFSQNFGVVAGSVTSGLIDSVTVSGILNINVPNVSYVGALFGTVQAELTNVKAEGDTTSVSQSKIIGLDLVGGIAGSATITGSNASYLDNNYNISGRDFVGGYFGYATGVRSPTINGYESVVVDGATQNLYHYNYGNIQGRNFVAGLVGYTDNLNINSTRNAGNVCASGYAVGGLVGYSGAQIINSENSSTNTQTEIVVSYNQLITSSTKAQIELASGIRTTFEQSALVLDGVELSTSTNWAGYFYGGLVGYLNGGQIRNATSSGVDSADTSPNINESAIRGNSFVGGIVGINNAGNIYGNNVYLEQIDVSKTSRLGIRNYNSVEGITFVGGIVGLNYSSSEGNGIIKDAVVQIADVDNISGEYCVGGIVGANFGYVWSVSATGAMSGPTANFGGIVGYNAGDLQYANSSMAVLLTSDEADSLSGKTSGIVCQAEINYYAGGLVGHNIGTIQKCAFTRAQEGSVDGTRNGIVRFSTGLLSTINSNITFTFSDVYVGGLVGVNEGTIDQAYVDNKTQVQFYWFQDQTHNGNHYISGLVGYNTASGEITNTYSLAQVIDIENMKAQGTTTERTPLDDSTIGAGLVYNNAGSIESSYARYSLANVNTGSISSDCFVMNSQTTTIQQEQEQDDGTTTTTPVEVTQIVVDDNYREAYALFLNNKYTLSEVTMSDVNCIVSTDIYVSDVTYARATVQMEFVSKDGKFADTEVLINNFELNVPVNDSNWYNSNMLCDCPGGDECECDDLGCCSTCECRDTEFSILGYRSNNCYATHANKWLEYFSSDIEYFKYIREHVFNNVVFGLAFTGLKTQANGTVELPAVSEDTIQAQPTTIPSTGFLGSGTADDPYRIYTVDDIETLNRQLRFGNNYSGLWFILMNDLDLSGQQGITIGTVDYPFYGSLDGNDKVIRNNNLSDTDGDNVGFFPTLPSGAQVIDLTFIDCTSVGQNNVGIVAGLNRGTIDNVKVYSSDTTTSSSGSRVEGNENVGGITGYATTGSRTIGCSVGANVSGTTNVGGIIGYLENGYVEACESVTTEYVSSDNVINRVFLIEGENNIGGIVGQQTGFATICECSNEMQVSAQSGFGGGIVGYSNAETETEDTYAIYDVVNRGNVTSTGISGQIAGRLENPANNVLALALNDKLLGEGTASSSLRNYHYVGNSSVSLDIWNNNGLKRDFYSSFDFIETWGMSPTQLNVSNNSYTNPRLTEAGLDDNYPRLMNLNSSKFLLEEYSFFEDQYFNVDDVDSITPTMYIESRLQFNILINYFLGRYVVDAPTEGETDFDTYSDFMSNVWQNQQYNYSSATFKLYKNVLTGRNSNINEYDYRTISYSSWTALPTLYKWNIDFSGITINISNLNDQFRGDDQSSSYAGFFSLMQASDPSYTISNLNLVINGITASRYVGGVVAYLASGTIQNCSVTYNGGAVEYTGGSATSYAGIIAGFIAENSTIEIATIKNCSYTCSNSSLIDNIFVKQEGSSATGYTNTNYNVG